MGTIIAVRKGAEIAMGSDAWNLQEPMIHPDLCINHGCIIELAGGYLGLSSSPAYQQAFEMALKSIDLRKSPPLSSREAIYDVFMRIHEILRNHYAMYVNFQQNQEFEWSPMLAILINKAGIFKIDSNRSVYEISRTWAIGSGQAFAIGAAEALYRSKKTASEIVKASLQVTCRMETMKDDNIDIVNIKLPKPAPKKTGSSKKTKAKKSGPATLKSVKTSKK